MAGIERHFLVVHRDVTDECNGNAERFAAKTRTAEPLKGLPDGGGGHGGLLDPVGRKGEARSLLRARFMDFSACVEAHGLVEHQSRNGVLTYVIH